VSFFLTGHASLSTRSRAFTPFTPWSESSILIFLFWLLGAMENHRLYRQNIKWYTIEIIKAPSTAHPKLAILNPLTRWDTSMSISAFMTSKKSPKVNIVIGNVKNIKIGLTITLIIPNTAATITATLKSVTFIPGNNQHVK
jgi:hypothetical protein